MKTHFMAFVLFLACSIAGFGQDATRSRNISATFPAVNYFLRTDGRWNQWISIFSGNVATNVTATLTRQLAPSVTNVTVARTLQTTLGYDSTGAAITNQAGASILIVTNVTVALTMQTEAERALTNAVLSIETTTIY